MAKLFRPEQVHLSNGIPVIFQHYENPVAATYWWIKTGSADEAPHEAGFAHFLEHMLFKDAAAKETGRASTGRMARLIESLGGDINAYTSFDQTVYHVTCAAQHWEKVLNTFGTMAQPQRFLLEDFEREREVILEELRKNEDSPGRQLFQTLFSTTFSKHPYGRPVIGFVKTLNEAKVSQLESFYNRQYVPEKMGLILVGPLNDLQGKRQNALLKYLEKYYGKKVLKNKVSKEKVKSYRISEPDIRADSEWKVKPFDVKTFSISFSFRVPDIRHEDMPALDLLSNVLGTGELSRLYQRLFYQTALVTDVSSGLYVPNDPGMLYFQAEVDSIEKIKLACDELLKELGRMIEEGPEAQELARVLVHAESERLYATQTADGTAGRLGFLSFIMGDLDFDQEYLEQLRAVTIDKIKEVAYRYLDYRRMSGVFLVPKEHSDFDYFEIKELAKKFLSPVSPLPIEKKILEYFKPIQNLGKKKGSELSTQFLEFSSGMRLCYNHRPQSHVFSVHASVLGGVRLEIACPVDRPESDWGASYMMALTYDKGTSVHNAVQVSSQIEGRAASLDGFAGRNTIGLQLTGLSRNWNELSLLFSEVLLDPAFPEEEVGHSRRIAEDSVRTVEDHSSQLCSKLFLETLFEHHPYGRMNYGSLESLAQVNSAKLMAFHKLWMRPERLVLSVSGPMKASSIEQWAIALEHQAKAAALGKGLKNSPNTLPISLEDEPDLKGPRWVEKPLGREQMHILVGSLGTRMTSEDRHTVRLLQTLLGGQSGRLFIQLREKKSLAYTVSPVSFEGVERGYIGTYIACSPEKKELALKGIQNVLETLSRKGPTEEEMKRAKQFLLGRRAMDLQSDSALAAHFGLDTLYQVPILSDKEMAQKIQRISAKEVQRVCRKYLVDQHMATVIVG